MKFVVITHVQHQQDQNKFLAYAPYVKEMNLWFNHVEAVRVVAPVNKSPNGQNNLLLAYQHSDLYLKEVPAFSFINFTKTLKALWALPQIIIQIFRACCWADHIHLRCPGNMGLLGCIVQILFPLKTKTAKYAGNWDPKSIQPFSYRLQKWLLNNRFLTRNMRVMVYGEWPGTSKNIIPFFTATYSEKEKTPLPQRDYSGLIRIVFAGNLSENKHPLKALQWVYQLQLKEGLQLLFDVYGDGPERKKLSDFIQTFSLEKSFHLHGNQPKEILKKAYQSAHFLILPSQSEGWPKVVAEAMFWGAIPLVNAVSCVPWMLGNGERGLLFNDDVNKITPDFISLLKNPESAQKMAEQASLWSRAFTTEGFEAEIIKLLAPGKV